MFISFWAFKAESLGTTMAAATQAQSIWSRLSNGKAGTGLWALGGSAVGHYGFHVATKTGHQNAVLRQAFNNDSEAQSWQMAFQGQFEFISHDLNREILRVTETSLKDIGFLAHWRFTPESLETMMASATESGKIWSSAGCESAALYGIQGSGVGQFGFEAHFADEESFGKVTDALSEDQAFTEWQMKYWGSAAWNGNVMANRLL
ncbi:MAG: hypothetical protein CMF26_03850 [Kiloniella sp.]|nr:hypothetical protein [Kiloniella sp.]